MTNYLLRLKAAGPAMLLLILLTALVCLSPGLKAQDAPYFMANNRKILIDSFNRQVEKLMDDVGVPGISLAIIDKDKIAFSKVYGYKRLAGKEKADNATIFEGASLSKTFLAFTVHKLVDQGMLNLDTPMYRYLDYEPLRHDPRYKKITVRMILSHSSGIENWKRYNNPDTLEIIADPGKSFVYSGEGYQYLAKVVDTILHRSYEEYIDQYVLTPLHLERTYLKFTNNGTFPENYATGHDGFGREVEKWKNQKAVPASGINLTAENYARLIIAIFNGKYLTPASVRDFYAPVVRISPKVPGLYFGMGLAVQYSPDDTIVFHNGSNSGFESMVWYSVVHRCGLVILTNSEREHVMEKAICDLAVNLKLDAYFADDDYQQYPSKACELLKIYREEGKDSLLSAIKQLVATQKPDIRTFSELGDLFADEDATLAEKILAENALLYPDSPQAFYQLGHFYMSLKEYSLAYSCLEKARNLQFDDESKLEAALKSCAAKLAAHSN
jgi:CubicO group peptidase (beta-lactamase class C family)